MSSNKDRRPSGKKPSERFEDLPTPPVEIEQLRQARAKIVPWQTYSLAMPDGSIFSTSGADLILVAESMTAVADAQKSGDEERLLAALANVRKLM